MTIPPSRNAHHVYSNSGNAPLIDRATSAVSVLDIGCGDGSNLRLLRGRFPSAIMCGVTLSEEEAGRARAFADKVFVADVEVALPPEVMTQKFDLIVLSHLLEHLREPAHLVATLSRILAPDGQILIAVPNIVSWRMRLQFLRGDFTYQQEGVLDETHLRFFSYNSAAKFLFARAPDLKVVFQGVSGAIPLWVLRRYILSNAMRERIDQWACRRWPNLFGGQVLIEATLK